MRSLICIAVLIALVALGGCGAGTGTTATQEASTAPRPAGNAHHAEQAWQIGRQACSGMSPREAALRYVAAARRAGVGKPLTRIVADPPPSVADSTGFPRLVAAVYAATVPKRQRTAAAAGCAEELAAATWGRASSTKAKKSTGPSPSDGPEKKGNSE